MEFPDRQSWLDAFYAAMRELVASEARGGSSGFEFMHYDVLAMAEDAHEPRNIGVHAMEAGLPTSRAVSYNGELFSATLDTVPADVAKRVVSWLSGQPENLRQSG